MTREAGSAKEAEGGASGNDGALLVVAAVERFDARLRAELAFAGRGLDSLSVCELDELEEAVRTRFFPVFDEIVERWQNEHGTLGEKDRIDRELRRRIVRDCDFSDGNCVCEACGFRNYEHTLFTLFHGLYLCDGCVYEARSELRDLQEPLVRTLEADPTVEHARALGFELIHLDDGRLVWEDESGDDYYDGGNDPYADEHVALECLVGELT